LEFAARDHVFLRVSRITGVGRALRSRKLSPKFLALTRSRGGLGRWLMSCFASPIGKSPSGVSRVVVEEVCI